jgi:uncharacterized protein DUF6174
MRALIVLIACFSVSCVSTRDLAASHLNAVNQATWQAADVQNYSFTLHWSSVNTSPERIGPNRIKVRKRKMVTATHVGKGGPYNNGDEVTRKLEGPTTVEALFSFIALELKGRDMWPVVATYDEVLGYPKSITLGDPSIMDGADFIEISEFVRE